MFADTLTTKALRTLGVTQAGDPLSAIDSATGFETLNDMLDGWAAQRLTVFQTLAFTYPLVAGKGSPSLPYTIGVGGDFNQSWPEWIDDATVLILTSTPPLESRLKIYKDDEWPKVGIKSLQSSLPSGLYYDHAFPTSGPTAGLGNVFFFPVPNGQLPLDVILYVPVPLTAFKDPDTTTYSFPLGYAEALRYQLMKRLAPEYGVALTPDLTDLAISTFAVIQRPNVRMPRLVPDLPGIGGGGGLYSWREGINR